MSNYVYSEIYRCLVEKQIWRKHPYLKILNCPMKNLVVRFCSSFSLIIKLNEEQKLTSKFVTFDCPVCHGKLQLRNEIEINPKGIKCSCNPCSFKISKSDKTMIVSRDDNGDIKLDSEAHSISFSWNRQITPEDKDKESTNRMIADVMNSTPRSEKNNHLYKIWIK